MLLLSISIAYTFFTLFLIIKWIQLKTVDALAASIPHLRITVVIAIRNEEKNIIELLEDLNRQTFSSAQTEVIIVDDHSTDNTLSIIQFFQQRAIFTLHVLELKNYIPVPLSAGNYKKKAIEIAVHQATGELIATTDGDCRVGKYWLNSIAQYYQTHQARFISGPVTFHAEQTLFEHLQTVEFASLIGSGAVLLATGMPVMCNGANLAYSKEAFMAAGGYQDTAGSPSGDDIFLLQKINRLYPGKAFFLKSPEAIVHTRAKSSWQEFLQQRKRWASKWNLYQDKTASLIAIFIFISNFSLLIGLVLVMCQLYPLRMFLIQIAIRFGIEFVFLTLVLKFLNKQKNIPFILPLQLVYFLYVSLVGLITHRKGYEWKGRKLK
ncbi:glycosyltransferase [Rhodocytophaga rosea]|uniref:Glycosyltransferase n=1 Tax=Rhodocytophaga rosea TaxID=2704465 RepID=A0A6C0GGY0_9BACT|nr:glycosyltransferase [Rhodocytophaga rosea]QHT67179.1 glycosyltransferase [Rhodocytophaga rosea]